MSWYKSQINNYRFYRIRNIALGFVVTIILLFISYPIIRGFIYLLSQDSIQQSLNKINDYNNLIVSILTFFLVLVTSFYAWVSLKMFREQSEHRKLELRPNISITVNDPIFIFDKTQNMRTTSFNFLIINFGKGTALNLTIDFHIPYVINQATGKFEYVNSSYRGQNIFFQSTQSEKGGKTIKSNFYELKKFTEEFLIISLSYEDVQRNIYNLKQYYNLKRFDNLSNSKSYLFLNKEMLFYTSFCYRHLDSFKQEEKKKLLWKTSRL